MALPIAVGPIDPAEKSAKTLAEVIDTITDLNDLKTEQATIIAKREADAQSVLDVSVGGIIVTGKDDEGNDVGYKVGKEAVAQAEAYLAQSSDDRVLDELAHTVFNRLRGASSEMVDVLGSRNRFDLMAAVPDLLDAEIAWADSKLIGASLTFSYWREMTHIDPSNLFVVRLMDKAVELAAMSKTVRDAIIVACTISVPSLSTTLDDAELTDVTVDDVRALLAKG